MSNAAAPSHELGFNYECPPTLAPFMTDSTSMVRAVRGCLGSGKTTAMIMELMRIAAGQTPGKDGIRRTRIAIVRNTFAQLKSTCLVSVQQILRPIIKFKVSDHIIYIEQGDIYSEWMLLPLDTEENIQRLLSLELTFVWASEFRELSVELLISAFSRTGRFPSKAFGGCARYGMIMETNSFSQDSPWYTKLEEQLPDNWGYTVQPGARTKEADWLHFLPTDYYEDLIKSSSPEWIEQYIDNKITPSLSGQAVFRASFVTARHVAQGALTPAQGYPLVVGLDTARNPAATICQVDNRGRLLVLEEIMAENMGVEKFVKDFLLPILYQRKYSELLAYVVFDPSGMARSQIGERSTYDMLLSTGLQCTPAMTNLINPRLRAVERFLNENRGDSAALLIDPSCTTLIIALQSRYRFRKRKDGELDDKPEKKHPWSDIVDSLQYAALGTSERLMGRVMRRARSKRDKTKPPPSAAGWT